ncbi:MAG: outer membrane lipoprotein LolB [Candidatus Competibacteraceae bacterium]|nr:outer membrane lipoprotein LolB [Candidatus Competibacteraceae bacterium]
MNPRVQGKGGGTLLCKPIRLQRYLGIIALLAPTVLLSGCATAPSSAPQASAWTARQTRLTQLANWQVDGRIGVISGQQGWHATFQWAQREPNYRIDLIGPLGQGRVVIASDGQEVRVQTQTGQTWAAPDPDDLLEQTLGVRLPVNGLRYWVRGLPAPGPTPMLQMDAEGRLTRLEQNGWVIEYLIYAPTSIAGLDLPERVIAQRGDLNIKLVIQQWTL